MLGNFPCFLLSAGLFSKLTSSKNSFRNTISVSNNLDPDISGSKVFAKVIRPILNVGLPCSYLPTQNRPYPQKIIAFLKFFSNYINKPFFKIIKSCTLIEERLQRLVFSVYPRNKKGHGNFIKKGTLSAR